jgi:RNA polymerase-binding transcription factor DksA
VTYLSCTQSKALAQTFDAMRRQALAKLWRSAPGTASTQHPAPATAQPALEGAARADDIRLAEMEDQHQRLDEIEQARRRLADGHYGFCLACGERIGAARLRKQPLAIRCGGCQAEFERRPH